jgi:hypothetical protein
MNEQPDSPWNDEVMAKALAVMAKDLSGIHDTLKEMAEMIRDLVAEIIHRGGPQ